MLSHLMKIFFGIAEAVSGGATVNPKGTKTLLDNGLSTFFIKGIPFFSNGSIN